MSDTIKNTLMSGGMQIVGPSGGGIKTPLNQDQVAIVDMLKEALAQAMEGKITSAAIVVCMKSGYAHVMAGRQAADLNLGCDSLKATILSVVEKEGKRMTQKFQR